MSELYEIWFEPTAKGKKSIGWPEKKVSENPMTADEAAYWIYESTLEEPSPDFFEFGRYVMRKVL